MNSRPFNAHKHTGALQPIAVNIRGKHERDFSSLATSLMNA